MYSGFRFVGLLPSISEQRFIQKKLLENIMPIGTKNNIKLLSVGVGDGYELNFLLSNKNIIDSCDKVVCVDISNKYFYTNTLENLSSLRDKLIFLSRDVRNLEEYFSKDEFDIIQCGFLMHEVKYQDKNKTFLSIFNLLKPNGYFLCSDIFIDNCKKQDLDKDILRMNGIQSLYNLFLDESLDCLKNNVMTLEDRNLFLGDGVANGLLKCMKRAIAGLDDYYEPLNQIQIRLRDCGFRNIATYENSKNPFLNVIICKKAKGI